jgi:hypothetical protein
MSGGGTIPEPEIELIARIKQLPRYRVNELDDMLEGTTTYEGALVSVQLVLALIEKYQSGGAGAAGAALAPLEFEDLRAARDACFSEAVRCEICARNTSDAGALRAAVEWRKTATRLDAALTQMSQLRAVRAGDPARDSE